jgi:hypothetical protein
MSSTRQRESGKPGPPFKHPGKMREDPEQGTQRGALSDTDTDFPETHEPDTSSEPKTGDGSKGAKSPARH